MNGKVYLVGAGPGDYKLLTIKGLEAIKASDVIIYDRLINNKLLKYAKDNCELIYVGKESSNHTLSQENINKLIADKAVEGKVVARLKGGDPYVFGRGGEEGEYLYNNGVDFEVVPGITSAIGGLCYAGIPITHRGISTSFHVITGHLMEDSEELDWKAIASLKGTLVFLMGMSNLQKIVHNLLCNGMSSSTPVAIINYATLPKQKVLTATLEDVYQRVISENIKSPSLIVVGEVVGLRETLNFFEEKTLFGKNIVVTRSRTQNSSLVDEINNLGGNAIEIPTIKINKIASNKRLKDAIDNIEKYNYILLTSVNGVDIFLNTLFDMGYDSRRLAHCKIVSIGPATSEELKKWGIRADFTPEKYVAEYIYDMLKDEIKSTDNILVPRAKEARKYLVDSLKEICSVDEIQIYCTDIENTDIELENLIDSDEVDYITFTSSSTVKNLLAILGSKNIEKLKKVKLISIGPVTSKTIKSYGLEVYKEAEVYTINGILDCIIDDIRSGANANDKKA
ncbi:uroporphyrinogen-III C-methyltransferase [Brassicibacter mesophilus]|uniref:uroporphyrinogen-III C-methyltransferase n=1 Tax=Brassicibacter mesophilus TaxID=745119 RepID=UPI003D1CDBE7